MEKVSTFVRLRPPCVDTAPVPPTWIVDNEGRTISRTQTASSSSTTSHQFAKVFTPKDSNENVFSASIAPTLDRCLEGRNGCVLCYGQTNSGKTYTMFGSEETAAPTSALPTSSHAQGIVDLSIDYIFARLEELSKGGSNITTTTTTTTKASNSNAHGSGGMIFRVALSFLEVYKERISDLLTAGDGSSRSSSPSSTTPVLRETPDGVTFVDNLTMQSVTSRHQGHRLVRYGNENKTFGTSYRNQHSSRAHTVLTLHGAYEPKEVKRRSQTTARVFRIHFVDLAGSELLTQKFGTQQQKETISINLSLLSLRSTICALAAKESFIPYRDSILTRLLSSSLSSQSVTTVLCMCSSDPQDATMTQATLRFGDIARTVEQRSALVEFVREQGKGARLRLKDTVPETEFRLDQKSKKKKEKAENDEVLPDVVVDVSLTTFDTRLGPIQGVKTSTSVPSGSSTSRVALFLHAFGNSCSGSDWVPSVMSKLSSSLGYTCYGIDFPGFGNTPGSRQSSRTDRIMNDSGSPLEIVIDVITAITPRGVSGGGGGGDKKQSLSSSSMSSGKVLLLGWDWGANMALCLALSQHYRNKISGLVLYHPSYTSPLETLAAIKNIPTLLLWQPRDQLHLIATGRRMARIMASAELITLIDKAGAGGESRSSVFESIGEITTQWLQTKKIVLTDQVKPPTIGANSKRGKKVPIGANESEDGDDSSDIDQSEDDDEEDDDGNDLISEHSSFLATILADPASAAVAVEAAVTREKKRRKELASAKTATAAAEGDIVSKLRSVVRDAAAASTSSSGMLLSPSLTSTTPVNAAIRNLSTILQQSSSTSSNSCSTATSNTLLQDVQGAIMQRGRQIHLRPQALSLLGHLPMLAPNEPLSTFVAYGLFSSPQLSDCCDKSEGDINFWNCPRYPIGRQVFAHVSNSVKIDFNMASVDFGRAIHQYPDDVSKNSKMSTSTSQQQQHKYLRTFHCYISGTSTTSRCDLQITKCGIKNTAPSSTATPTAANASVSWSDIDEFNQPTKFPQVSTTTTASTGAGVIYRFEDNIVCRYHDLVTRTKLCEMALAIAPWVVGGVACSPSLRFKASFEELHKHGRYDVSGSTLGPISTAHLDAQMEIINCLRRKMDMTHHVRVGRDPDRLCVPDAGRLATYGQWHCHGMASVFAAMLLPFCAVVGFEVRYRDGYWYRPPNNTTTADIDDNDDDTSPRSSPSPTTTTADVIIPRRTADHTWLEITFLPSMRSYVCDPSLHYDDEAILVSLEAAYSLRGKRFPTRNLEGGSFEPVPGPRM